MANNIDVAGLFSTDGTKVKSMMNPATAYLLGKGLDILIGGVSAGVKGGQEREMLMKQLELQQRQQEEQERMNRFNMASTTRGQNMSGIGMLADMRSQAMERHKRDMFKNDLWRVMG